MDISKSMLPVTFTPSSHIARIYLVFKMLILIFCNISLHFSTHCLMVNTQIFVCRCFFQCFFLANHLCLLKVHIYQHSLMIKQKSGQSADLNCIQLFLFDLFIDCFDFPKSNHFITGSSWILIDYLMAKLYRSLKMKMIL